MEQKEQSMSIVDLPDELVMKILSNLDYQYHNRFRCTSKHLRGIHTEYMMHWYLVFKHRVSMAQSSAEKPNVYTIIQYSTEYYMLCGYQSQFCGCLVSLYNRLPKGETVPHINKVCDFLSHFYRVVELEDEHGNGFKYRLLSTLTLFNLFNKFKSMKVLKFKKCLLHWRIELELRGKFMGILWSNTRPERPTMKKRNELFNIVSQLLYSDLLELPMQRFWELKNIVYIYGTVGDFSKQLNSPARIVFTFMINTHDSLVPLLKKALFTPNYVPDGAPFEEVQPGCNIFDVNLRIKSRAALAWGCDNGVLELDMTQFEWEKEREKREKPVDEVDDAEQINDNGTRCILLNV